MQDEARALEVLLRPSLPGVVVRPVRRSHWSRVFRGDSAPGGSVVIKLCIDPTTGAPDGGSARRYYDALRAVADLSRLDAAIGCSAPLLLLEPQALVVARWISGPTVEHVVAHDSLRAAGDALRQSGDWLARFQIAAGLHMQPWDMASMLAQVEREIAAGPVSGPMSANDARLARSVAGLLRDTAPSVGNTPIGWSRQHGDFKPGNLILVPGGVAAIDIEFPPSAPCVLDAAQFLNHAALQRPLRLWRGGWVSFTDDAFLAGTRSAGVMLPAMPLAWARLHHALRLLLRYREWSKPPRAWVAGWGIRGLATHLRRQLSAAANQPSDGAGDRET